VIRSEEEHQAALRELRRDRRVAREQERLLAGFGLKRAEIEEAVAPLRAVTERLRREIAAYESLRSAA
jgi:hypothetical protein